MQIDAEGQVTAAKIVAGGVVDTLGDLCVVGELESAQVAAAQDTEAATSIHVPLTFFYEGPILFNESSGRSAPPDNILQIEATPGAQKQRRRPNGSAAPGRSMGA